MTQHDDEVIDAVFAPQPEDEVERLIREAIPFHLDGLREAGDPIPAPAAVATALVEVPAA